MSNIVDWQTVWDNKKRFSLGFSEIPLFRGNSNLFFQDKVGSGYRIVDFGCGDKKFEMILVPKKYVSVDIDPSRKPDFSKLSEVNGEFDCVVSRFVIEHLTVDEIKTFFSDSFRVAPKLVFNTHNAWGNYGSFAGDYTHKSLLSFRALGGLLSEAGYSDVRFFRIADMGLVWLREPFSRLVGFDFCLELGCVAVK